MQGLRGIADQRHTAADYRIERFERQRIMRARPECSESHSGQTRFKGGDEIGVGQSQPRLRLRRTLRPDQGEIAAIGQQRQRAIVGKALVGNLVMRFIRGQRRQNGVLLVRLDALAHILDLFDQTAAIGQHH